MIEHRIPKFGQDDTIGTISYAQRSNVFYRYGQTIIRLCRSFTFIVSSKDLPKTSDAIKKILTFLTEKKPGRNDRLEIVCNKMITHLEYSSSSNQTLSHEEKQKTKAECRKFGKELKELMDKLYKAAVEELPNLKAQ